MSDSIQDSPIQRAKRRMDEVKRREAELMAYLTQRTAQGKLSEEDAKRIAATLMEMMKQ
ncbi:hypothetical protein G3480_25860 [Thiorhodococcus mannitoliphagus]|uniref:Uncharacterized protein n=1 Tax=Thiorhodococcus mannitoliphagus TaxID=329406 RepID=A0A6P1DZB7_9GAMM|nr:hypothetical protein [Thiorhodococcus mannitoliphagus]NEX23657.1 hypothetical protein [Thiorhodococcus mannitoliphagus]